MIEMILILIVSFFSTLLITPKVIKYFKAVDIVTADVHKKGSPLVPNSAGVLLAVGVITSLLFYIFIKKFVYGDSGNLEIFAAITTMLTIMFVGFLDDLNSKQKKVAGFSEGKSGLKAWQKPLFTLPAAIPLMVIMAGNTSMFIPIIGEVNFGILYPLFIVPAGVVVCANMVNMLDGFNGLGAGMGLVYSLSLGVFSLLYGNVVSTILLLSTFAALVAILKYNWAPAKILSGDSLTYTLGAIVAISAILGNIEKAAIITMMPFVIQGVLKFYAHHKLGRFPSDMGILQKDGTIKPKYDRKIYSWTHVAMNIGKLNEKQIVLFLMGVQAIFSIIPFLKVI